MPRAIVFALLRGAPDLITRRRMTETPMAPKTKTTWSMCTANIYRLSKKPILNSGVGV